MVSAGDAGVNNLAALRRYIVAQTRTRMYAFIHIANNGLSAFPVAELYNIDNAQVEACAMALAENPDFLIGVKVRMSENVIFKHGVEPLKRAIQACEMCGGRRKMMVHIGGVETTELMSDILDLLRPGDILTHCLFRRAEHRRRVHQHRAGRQAVAGRAGRQAARRGVRRRPWRRQLRFHRGRGGDPRRRTPDTISSDIHVFSGNSPGMPFLPGVMSKFMAMGFSLEQVVAMATTRRPRSSTARRRSAPCRSARPATSRSWNWWRAR